MNTTELWEIAQRVFRAGVCPPDVRSADAAFAVMLAGAELGAKPMQALRSLSIVKGKVSLTADFTVALCVRSPVCEWMRCIETTPERATYETKRRGHPEPSRLSWTIAQAQTAGLTGSQTWRSHPAAMLRARCASALARSVYPDLVAGVYDPDEAAEIERDGKPESDHEDQAHKPEEIDLGAEAETSDAQLPTALEAFYACVAEIELPGEGVAVWIKHRADLAPLNPADRENAWKALCAKVEDVGKMKNAKVWLKKAISEEDAHRGQPDEPPPDGTIGPRRGPGPVASAEGSASVSGGAGGAPAATVTALVPEWATTVDGMRAHLADKTARRAVEHSVRQHGKRLGATYRRLAAERIVTLDTPADDGTRLSLIGATQLVDAWAQQGPIARKAVAR